jgi:hypothetical protein
MKVIIVKGARILILGLTLSLGGCGTYVPEIQEFWGSRSEPGVPDGDPTVRGDATLLVNKIAGQVACELARAVQQVYLDQKMYAVQYVQRPGEPPPPQPKARNLSWFEKWAVQATLTLTILEQSTLNAGLTTNNILNNATTVFGKTVITTAQSSALGFGLGGSTAATRTDKLSMFFSVGDLKNGPSALGRTCIPPPQNATLFVQSDLKIYDWLQAALLPNDAGIFSYASNSTAQNVIQHDVKFQIVTNGGVTPTWKLVNFTANTSGQFFSLDRDRTQDLLMTFGPAQKNPNTDEPEKELSTAAQDAHLAALIGEDVAKALKPVLNQNGQ